MGKETTPENGGNTFPHHTLIIPGVGFLKYL